MAGKFQDNVEIFNDTFVAILLSGTVLMQVW